MAEPTESPDLYVNVPVSQREERRIQQEERAWTGPRLVIFSIVFLALCLAILWVMASTTSETTWGDWLFPWPIDH